MTDLSAVPFRTLDIDGTLVHAFGGFPYLVTKVASALYHVTLLPPGPAERLVHSAYTQWEANRLDICLCLDWDKVVFVQGLGRLHAAVHLPYASLTLADAILPGSSIDPLPFADPRVEQLERFIDEIAFPEAVQESDIFLNPLKGGCEGPADERALLLGRSESGIPRGLFRCQVCGEFRGSCLDPSFELRGITVPVFCKCVNNTRCAVCGEPFDEHRLNTNYYDPGLNEVIQVSALPALRHRCEDGEAASQ